MAGKKKIKSDDLTPIRIVELLDNYIIGQAEAKKSVAIAMRNRWRRQKIESDMRDEVTPKNILMIGSTGVGKTEIARRLADLTGVPFLKVEASKYTEVGYHGRDVESMVRDLAKAAIAQVQEESLEKVATSAREAAQERVMDIILPPPRNTYNPDEDEDDYPHYHENTNDDDERDDAEIDMVGDDEEEYDPYEKFPDDDDDDDDDLPESVKVEVEMADQERYTRNRSKLLQQLKKGKFDKRQIEIKANASLSMANIFGAGAGSEEMVMEMQEMLGKMLPSRKKTRKVTIAEAVSIFQQEEAEKLVDEDSIQREGIIRAEQGGIIFIDEIDKIIGNGPMDTIDVSREGVQRDLLPIVEGSTVMTKYGPIKTDHILFIAAGAFHGHKPSELIPELQGRFPIRVELSSLTREDFKRILTHPRNAICKQYELLLATEGVKLVFEESSLDAIAEFAANVNNTTQDIGARRLHTIIEKLLEDISFDAASYKGKRVVINAKMVQSKLADIVKNDNLSHFIL
ncbi:MAG: ATP-dependent protease ATPase subunit HslU [Planctomycetota bacterium]|jgi:ATP-dependent HslUV protease ATP-binding subunit HslU|nr:ATP-dependent protease ATPase subunit HslU [Planctomycetota bacterium]